MNIHIKRIYENPDPEDGIRVLVDRLWPRGISKGEAKLDAWWKETAPSDALRKWFDHDPKKWEGFKKKYRDELEEKKDTLTEFRADLDERKRITLLYGAKDEQHNQAVVLKNFLSENH